MQKRRLNILFITPTIGLLSILFSGCSGLQSEYVPPSIILPAHIKTISVRALENESSIPGIGTKLWLAVTDEFIRDGRIAYSDDEQKSEGVVVGRIKQYHNTPLTQDVSLVAIEYQLWVVMEVKFLDRTQNQYLWEEPLLEQKLRYFAETSDNVSAKTEEEAREELWERFANDIVRRTIEGFGTVTSSSPRAVPKERPDIPPPAYPASQPY